MFWLFRLPPIVYWLLCPAGIALAGFMYVGDRNNEAEKAVALAAKPPAAVKIEAFDPARDTGTAHEVTIIGQVDMEQAMEVTRTRKNEVREQWVIAPIYATTAADSQGPAIGMLLQRGMVSDAQLERLVVGRGPFGPLLELNGTSVDPASEREALATVRDRIAIAPGAVYVDPFEAGRRNGLKASTNGRDTAIGAAVVSLLIGLYGIGLYFFAGRGSEGYI
jgi:hypothetical protein